MSVSLTEYTGLLLGDAYHITQPQADGRGAALAMMRALQQVIILLYCPLAQQFMNRSSTSIFKSPIKHNIVL